MDAVTLAAIARELNETLAGGRVQAVGQPDEHSLALEIYSQGERRWLLLDADPQHPRAHLLPAKARRGVETDTPFLLLTRKHLLGARLRDVFQPAWERLLHLSCDHPEHGAATLVAEIMGKWSNLVLLDGDGVILQALRCFRPDQNPRRPILPGRLYLPPPPQADKTPIDLLAPADLDHLLASSSSSDPLWRLLVRDIAGLSPLVARELVHRATGNAQATSTHPNARPLALFDALSWLRSLPRQGGWSPTIARDPADGSPTAFAPYELSHLDPIEPAAAISQAAHIFYTATIGADRYAGRRAHVQALLDAARKRLHGRRASLGEQAVSAEQVEELRSLGDWILAYTWQIRAGDTELLADTGAGHLHIPLDPTLSPAANAQAYYARYHKAKRAAAQIPDLLAAVDRDLAYLDQLQTDLHLADNAPQIEELRAALLTTGLVSEPRDRARSPLPRSQPLRLQSVDGLRVIIGRNAIQNESVTWDLAEPDDLWLHAERVPGSHVVIKTAGRATPTSTLLQAAAWAAYYSQARHDAKVSVLYTQRRHLRRIPDARPGQVRVLQSQTIVAAPQAPADGANT